MSRYYENHEWLKEWRAKSDEWNREYKKARDRIKVESDRPDDVKIENLLGLAREAKRTPEIWDYFVKIADMSLDDLRLHEGSFEGKEDIHFFGCFEAWYRMKQKLYDNPYPYFRVSALLYRVARGEIDDIDSPEARAFLLSDASIIE